MVQIVLSLSSQGSRFKILEISVGSISGLKSILLLVDLCTCRISGQNQNLKMFTLGDFWFIKYNVNKFCGAVAGD